MSRQITHTLPVFAVIASALEHVNDLLEESRDHTVIHAAYMIKALADKLVDALDQTQRGGILALALMRTSRSSDLTPEELRVLDVFARSAKGLSTITTVCGDPQRCEIPHDGVPH